MFSKIYHSWTQSISSYALGLVKDCEDSSEDPKKEITTIINPKGNEFGIGNFSLYYKRERNKGNLINETIQVEYNLGSNLSNF